MNKQEIEKIILEHINQFEPTQKVLLTSLRKVYSDVVKNMQKENSSQPNQAHLFDSVNELLDANPELKKNVKESLRKIFQEKPQLKNDILQTLEFYTKMETFFVDLMFKS